MGVRIRRTIGDWQLVCFAHHRGSGPADLFATLAKSILNLLVVVLSSGIDCCCMSMLNERTVADRRLTRRSTSEDGGGRRCYPPVEQTNWYHCWLLLIGWAV